MNAMTPDLTTMIPADALKSHIAILGKTGSGKSNVAKVIAEHLIRDDERVCFIDPTGTAWGLRAARDGKGKSDLDIIIFGGDHGDIAIGEQHGAVVAEAIGTSSNSAIVDTLGMTDGQRTRFFTDFAGALLRTNRGGLHLIIDEAHIFAPQGQGRGVQSNVMLSATNDLVSLGRGRGIQITLITQRPQKLSKDSLTQAETLIAMRLFHPLDIDAVGAWIDAWAKKGSEQAREITSSLPSMPVGMGWVWAPVHGVLHRVKFPLASTFDSGSPSVQSVQLVPIDIEAMGDRMDKIRQESAANDPKKLRARIAELERQRSAPAAAPAIDVERVRAEAYAAGYAVGAAEVADKFGKMVVDFAGTIALAVAELPHPAEPAFPVIAKAPPAAKAAHAPRVVPSVPVSAPTPLSAPQARVVRALSMWKALGKTEPSKIMVAAVAGYSHSSGGFGNLLGALRSAGFIEYPSPGLIRLVADEITMTPAEGRDMLLTTLSNPQRKLFDALIHGEMSKAELGDATGYSPTSGGFGNLLGSLRSMGLVEYPSPGRVCLAAWVFDII